MRREGGGTKYMVMDSGGENTMLLSGPHSKEQVLGVKALWLPCSCTSAPHPDSGARWY